jgi:type II secretory pathway pseudopilin PulG
MDPATILALIGIINAAATMIAQHANGQQPTADDLTALQQQTKQLSDQIDALRTDKPQA